MGAPIPLPKKTSHPYKILSPQASDEHDCIDAVGRNTGGDGVRPTKVRHAVVAPAVSTHAQAIGEGRQAQPVPPMPSAGREPEGSSAALDRLTISRFPHQPHMGHHSWERKGNDPGTVTTLAKVPQCHQASEDPGDPLRDPISCESTEKCLSLRG